MLNFVAICKGINTTPGTSENWQLCYLQMLANRVDATCRVCGHGKIWFDFWSVGLIIGSILRMMKLDYLLSLEIDHAIYKC